MKKIFFIFLLVMSFPFLDKLCGLEWDKIKLPNEYVVPEKVLSRNVYSTQLPSTPLVWVRTTECNTLQPTSIHWKSNLIEKIKGLSFKGLVFKLPELRSQGSPLNSFSVFFHESGCYVAGTEYGWVFYESELPRGQFYICYDCNISGIQKWATWPGTPSALEVVDGDSASVEQALEDSGIYRYWNIKLTPEGNFYLELVNPSNYDSVWVTLKKPSWLPNLYNVPGFVTVSAKRQGETLPSSPYMHVDDIKVWQ